MQWTGLNELRDKYLTFFEGKGHLRLDSFPLVPKNDPSLLLINSGMAPMKKWFLAQEEPPRHRVTTCQKCIRTPDIERVGITARHGTFFEMLGNFSFQDYFKKEVIPWAWEFLTKELEIPADRLYISVYQEDDEAYDIWTKQVGIPEDHMVRLGKEDNFWEHGSGPCGPCSEIYFDRGLKYGCGKPGCTVGCDCDRYIEIWNNVFSQFDNDGHNNYTELKQKNIDTGMGLERLACVCQNVDSLFDVDTVMNITHKVSQITGAHYGESHSKDVSLRVTETDNTDSFNVAGRGEMSLSILIETMRREGYELQVSPPHVLTKVIDGKTYEPMEHVVIDVPTQYQGAVMTGLGQRKAILQQMESLGSDRVRLEFRMPSRGLFGYRNQFLTDTHGEGIINQIFDGYDVWAGMIANRSTGSLVSFETGEAVTYGLFNAQQRGTLLVGPGEKVYEGMVIGYTASGEDVDVNVCKTKHLTNTRASGSDDALRLVPVSKFSLEGCLEFLAPDELLEVTPENLRIRKRILDHDLRMKAASKKNK